MNFLTCPFLRNKLLTGSLSADYAMWATPMEKTIRLIGSSRSGRFDNSSAAFTIESLFHAYAAGEQTPIEISFLGKIDHSRSGELIDRYQPQWKYTLGFFKSLYGPIEGGAGRVRRYAGVLSSDAVFDVVAKMRGKSSGLCNCPPPFIVQ